VKEVVDQQAVANRTKKEDWHEQRVLAGIDLVPKECHAQPSSGEPADKGQEVQ
jgi:hypothetical protein